jgi:hypothetical protein
MKKENKYLYGWKFYVNYGLGWEYENFETTRKGMIENKKQYLKNCPYPLKISRGRELNNNNKLGE